MSDNWLNVEYAYVRGKNTATAFKEFTVLMKTQVKRDNYTLIEDHEKVIMTTNTTRRYL